MDRRYQALGGSSMRKKRRWRFPGWLAGLALVGTAIAVTELDRRQGRARRRSVRIGGMPPMQTRKVTRPLWKAVLLRTYDEINDDRVLALAAGIVFYGLLAIFPAVTASVSSYGLFVPSEAIGKQLSVLSGLMPAGAYKIIEEQIARVIAAGTGKLSFAFLFGLGLAVWSANAGIKAMIDALNIIYDAKETRSFIKLNAISLTFTVGAIVALLLAVSAVVVAPVVLTYFGITGEVTWLPWLRWPVLLVMLVFGLQVLYRFGPDAPDAQWRWYSPGSVFAAVAWMAGSGALSYYLANYANYDATYGSLGAGIGLMMWLWMTSIVVLVGAELNSVFDELQPNSD